MNKDILNQIAADEQPMASTLVAIGDDMKISQTFQWKLETQLMDAYKTKSRSVMAWAAKITRSVAWGLLVLGMLFLLNWTIRSGVIVQPAESGISEPEVPFEHQVRQGDICTGPLAMAHNFSVFLTNADKTGFVNLNEQKIIGELRSFAWSPDGRQLAVVGTTTGQGNIYLAESADSLLRPVLIDSPLGYLMDVTWSQDGKQLITWSLQDNSTVYLLKIDEANVTELQLDLQVFATPLFAPDNQSLILYGASASVPTSLIQIGLDGSPIRVISSLVEDESGFARSPDGSQLAYMEMDRELGEARLIVEAINGSNKVTIAKLPIPKGSGSSIPESGNLSWAHDSKTLVFDFGRGATDRTIYLDYADGTELVIVVESAYAPTISADGNCLAYISNKQVFLLDLTNADSTETAPLLIADLPAGQVIGGFKMDKLQWGAK